GRELPLDSVSARRGLAGECWPHQSLPRQVRDRVTSHRELRRKLRGAGRRELDPIRLRSFAVTGIRRLDYDRGTVSNYFGNPGRDHSSVIAHADDRVGADFRSMLDLD